jgi:methylenetetrahydrofolate--tRNA-(uracil-5-)-methyltransferase
VNCPLDKAQYEAFVAAVVGAEKVAPRAFEEPKYFEGCLPVEVMAERGPKTLSFGPMKPVGLTNPKTGRRPWAVVQLRPEDLEGTAFNLVGFQTRMKWPEQKRVFGMIPGLANAEFLRFGSVHRNTFVNAPVVLDDDLSLRARPGVHLAGQVTGVEGYVESAACGLVLGTLLAARARGEAEPLPPRTTALGALHHHLRAPNERFQPSNVLWSMFPPLASSERGRERHALLADRALADLPPWLAAVGADAVRARLPKSPEPVPAEATV